MLVPGAGVEPAHAYAREILSLLCLPISPPGQIEGCTSINGAYFNTYWDFYISISYIFHIFFMNYWKEASFNLPTLR